ncbi:MAG TPA: leucyl aminopeptidase [Bdellovibrionales bacterium]|nr:leucyl aminopeptidase [Bdellovibrionales bacterium]
MNIKLSSLQNIKPQLAIVFVSQGGAQKKKVNGATSLAGPASFQDRLSALAEDKFFEGKSSEAYCVRDANLDGFRHVLFVGLGDEKKITLESLRRGAATAYKTAKAHKAASVGLLLPNSWPKGLDAPDAVAAITEGAGLAAYTFDTLKSKKTDGKDEKKDEKKQEFWLLTAGKGNKSLENAVEQANILVESINFARWLGDMPGNKMTPAILADEAAKAAKGTGIKVQVWDKARIKKEGMGGLLGVSLGSAEEPRFIIMEYNGAAASKKPVCFVGKGLTFDSGGISIKPSANMEEMKYDMCGGAAVIGTILALARTKAKVNVLALIASTENMPGPHANKPGDVLTARNGKTIEVNNTDAEGRVILADALSYASEQKPAAIIDAATLTGAMVVALGDLHTGYFTRDKKLNEKIQDAAETAGEWVWPMPLVDEHVDDMKGVYADWNNISPNKGAGSAHGAAFLEQFVDKDIPWAHFDIAGTAWHTGHRIPYNPKKGASGCVIRTFVELAKTF